jgi:steroid 5-alpha reductase family enzyme
VIPVGYDLLVTLAASLAIQAAFFAFAATLRTDKVTDLSYGLTFIVLAWLLARSHAQAGPPGVVLALMVTAWGLRLSSYLLYRIIRIGRDARFDGVRERFWPFLRFWFFQGVAVWAIMLPVTLWFGRPGPWTWDKAVAVAVWATGLVIETAADIQKFRFKQRAHGKARWVDTGLWQYSRHPNYFGEMLCWWGTFLFAARDLGPWVALGAVGPVTVTIVLLYVTGVPTLERSANEKWASDPAYQAYRERTRLLVPWP